jgi:hypothetical protein
LFTVPVGGEGHGEDTAPFVLVFDTDLVPGYQAATYVEGIVVQVVDGGGFTFASGWVEKDGEIIDPTLPSHEFVYFPGLRFVGLRGQAGPLAIPKYCSRSQASASANNSSEGST